MKKFEEETIQSPRNIVTLGEGAYLHTAMAGAWVPFQKAVICGFIVAMIALIFMLRFYQEEWAFVTALTFAVTVAITWTLFQFQLSKLMGLIERAVNYDLDHRGGIGNYEPEPQPAPQTMRVEVVDKTDPSYPVTKINAMPHADKMPKIAIGMIAGVPFTMSRWVGQTNGNLLSAPQWREIRDAMLQNGWISPRNPTDESRGYQITRPGLSVLREYAKQAKEDGLDASWTRR